MSRYNKLIKEILDGIFEGYALEDGKLKVVNESAAKTADSALHKLVLEKSRDLWDQLEASAESLTDVAEEISFEELNLGPDSMETSTGPSSGASEEPAQMQEPTLENLLGAGDFNLDELFEMDHLDSERVPAPMKPPIKELEGEDEEDVVDGAEDFEDMEFGKDDAGMGAPDMTDGEEEMDPGMEPENGEMGMEPEGDEMGMDLEPEGDMEGGASFDFDLELGDEGGMEMSLEPENGEGMEMELEPENGEGMEMELEPENGEEEEAEEGLGRMEY